MADNYQMPYMETNKTRENIQKNTALPGYVSYFMVLLMFVLMLLAAVVLAVGTGLLVYFVAGSDKECKVVLPENYLPNTGEQKGTDKTTDSAINGDTSTETPEETSIASLQSSITNMLAQLNDMSDRLSNGATYIRWGRTTCPGNTTTIYAGYAAGSHYTYSGGTANIICLPTEPQWGNFYSGQQPSYIYGAEYEISDEQSKSIFGKPVRDQDVPCAVCQTRGRPNQMMIPARTECMSGWFLEYTGYLMTDKNHRSDVKCVDKDPESLVGRSANDNGVLFYFVEANGQILDPPYIRGRKLTCVVCSQ